jgi:hypothetical protein
MKKRNSNMGWLDRMMTAITFAEAGEAKTALEVSGMNVERKSPRISSFDRLMTAITFAEAGDADTALEITGRTTRKTRQTRRSSRSTVDHRPRLWA